MFRYAILFIAIFFSASNVTVADNINKIFYEKCLPDGRSVKIFKSTYVKKTPKSEGPYMYKQTGNRREGIVVVDIQVDKYSMTITDGNSESVKVWEKEILTPIFGQPDAAAHDFKIHDVKTKNDLTAILFSKEELIVEVIGPDPSGVRKVLFSKSLAKRVFPLYLSIPYLTKGGQLVWLDEALYVLVTTRYTVFWELKNAKAKSDVFSEISGPFSFYRIIKNTAETD